jgi:uncharacterized protein
MDPMAELVKIDPKSIGVGQYQHDVDQALLKKSLDDTVTFSVNSVGVALNTASKQLLMYVSGLGPSLAQHIVNYRNDHGPFQNRKELLAVPKLGPKAFEQAAGFLRIRNGSHPLDATGIHPERYALVELMAADLGVEVQDLIDKPELRTRIQLTNYISDTVGKPTLLDIMEEFENEGLDPREDIVEEELSNEESGDESVAVEVSSMSDLAEGMWVHGTVTNVADFGAFVDIGVGQDGLIHISQLASRFVKHPSEIVNAGEAVKARVLNVDEGRGRISLSLKEEGEEDDRPRGRGGDRRGGDRRGGGGGFNRGGGGGYNRGGGGGYGDRRGGGGGYGDRRGGGGGGRKRYNDGDDYRPRRRDDDFNDRY